jgi:FkbM family methyltransferase
VRLLRKLLARSRDHGNGAAVAAAPDDPQGLFLRATVLAGWGRHREADAVFRQAEALGMRGVALEMQYGENCLALGDLVTAEERMRRAVALAPESSAAHCGLASVLAARAQIGEAVVAFDRALALDPDNVDARLGLGNCLFAQNDFAGAEVQFLRIAELEPARAVGWHNLGAVLERVGRLEEAIAALRTAEQLDRRNDGELDSFANLAFALAESGNPDEAIALYERWLPERPGVLAYYAYSQLLLAQGRFAEGWDQYRFRWLNEPLLSVRYRGPFPAWTGQPLHGKSIRLRLEQGIGDMFQFVRYATLLKDLGASVQIPRFVDFAGRFAGIDHVDSPGEPPPAFDYYVNMLDLPGIFGTDAQTIPATIPYLSAEPERVARWAPRLTADGGALRVGLVWAGNPSHPRDRFRSLDLRLLTPLGRVQGLHWYSLQKDARERDGHAGSEAFDWIDLGPELTDFNETLAVVSQLDLVLCVDTAVAHLAGALGKPVWVLIAEPSDWRWMKGRKDSPWYPTMRLFRQQRRGDWAPVVERVKDALAAYARDGVAHQCPPLRPVVHEVPNAPTQLHAPPHSGLIRAGRPGLSAVTETRYGILQYIPDEPDVGEAIGRYGEYRSRELELLAGMIAPGQCVLEVGAGVGAHALLLAAVTGPAGHLILVETRMPQHRILRQNLAANRVGNVTLIKHATGGRPSASAGDDGASTVAGAADLLPMAETVDTMCLERLDWLKINVCARAVDVLSGTDSTLWRLRPQVFIAAPDGPVLAGIADRMREFGYRCWRVETPYGESRGGGQADPARHMALALLAVPEECEPQGVPEQCIEIS